MAKKGKNGIILLDNSPFIVSYAAAVGKKEGEGPFAAYFDCVDMSPSPDGCSWEKEESGLQQKALHTALKKGGLEASDIDILYAGDLLNQSISSTFGLREFGIPFVGLFGACSTMSLSLSMASLAVNSGAADKAAAVTSSHFCTAERQFRTPVDYGGQRTPSAQWTVCGSGAVIVGKSGKVRICDILLGKITDLGQTDANNMGAAMAPAAADTISRYLDATETEPSDYDMIVTGDLGTVGSQLLHELLIGTGIDISRVHKDCGMMIFDLEKQDVHAGGSGCGCSASMLCGYILRKMEEGEFKNVLFCATGALMSTTSSQQGESIPGICHVVHLTA